MNASIPEKNGPEKTGPEQTGPEKTDPEQTGPEKTDPEKTDPEKTSPQYLRRLQSPIGTIELTGDGAAVTSVTIAAAGHTPLEDSPERSDSILNLAAMQLGEYFAGTRRNFDVPVRVTGTVFQREVWARLSAIEFGQVTSYGRLGLDTGRFSAGRAVGGAVGANPVPILVPCHRVLGATNRITGFSGGDGIVTKQWLLAHEGILPKA